MIIVITGTSRGIGKQLAEYYLNKGDTVYGCGRSESSIFHEKYRYYSIDISDEDLVHEMIKYTYKKEGRIDVLINNAGIASMNHICTTPYNTVIKTFETNFYGSFLFCREVSKIMMRQNFGRIINFSTIAVRLNLEGEMVYTASKSAVEKMTQILAKELGTFGVTVNAIAPTPIKTDLIKSVSEEKIQKIVSQQSIKRMTTINDITKVIDFFIENDFVTGQIINLG